MKIGYYVSSERSVCMNISYIKQRHDNRNAEEIQQYVGNFVFDQGYLCCIIGK